MLFRTCMIGYPCVGKRVRQEDRVVIRAWKKSARDATLPLRVWLKITSHHRKRAECRGWACVVGETLAIIWWLQIWQQARVKWTHRRAGWVVSTRSGDRDVGGAVVSAVRLSHELRASTASLPKLRVVPHCSRSCVC